MLNFDGIKNVGFKYSRVGAGAASKFLPEAGAASK
jgi:hypothetical protein